MKKVSDVPVPSRDVTDQTYQKMPRESLVSDIPAGNGNEVNLFFTVNYIPQSGTMNLATENNGRFGISKAVFSQKKQQLRAFFWK